MFRVLTYNIHKGFRPGNLNFVGDAMKIAAQSLNPDLLFLQEVVGEHKNHEAKVKGWANQHELFKCELLPHVFYGKNVIYPHGHHGNTVLSRTPFDFERNVDISVFKIEPRGFIHAHMIPTHGTRPIHALCVHLGLLEYERRIQVKSICDYIAKNIPSDEPLILAGDFNDWWQNASATLKSEVGLSEASEELFGLPMRSFPSWLPVWRLDRIYFKNLKLKNCERPTGFPWSRLSDHLPIIADFEFL